MKICANCFNDTELKSYIESNYSDIGRCDYCENQKDTATIEIVELLDFFSEFLEIFDKADTEISLIKLIQSDWELFSDDVNAIELLDSILRILDVSSLKANTKVTYSPVIKETLDYWEILKNDVKWFNRFLPNLDNIEEFGWDRYFSDYFQLPNDMRFYRARLHSNNEQNKFENNKMGRPPKEHAAGGRANPKGIPYLYLSESLETTLYEIRATFLDEISVGTFQIKNHKAINVIDFTEYRSAFLSVGNIIEHTKSTLLKRIISRDLSKPLRRYDSELEYIPTQFICEYIRNNGADGIIFNSSLHNGGHNLVLFNEDKVECVSVEKHRVKKIEIKSEPISE